MPPVYRDTWIWLLMKVDYKTGEIKTSMNRIAQGVSWVEWDVEHVPNRRTISKVLDYLQAQEMINHESNRLFTKISVLNWDRYNDLEQTKVTPNAQVNAQVNAHYSRSEPKKLKEEVKDMPADAGASTQAVEVVATYYKAHIHPKSRLLESGKKKVRSRLSTFTADELIEAMDHFKDYRDPRDGSAWWMENNAWRGFDWFFESDKRIEQFRNLPAPSENGKAHHPPAMCPDHGPSAMRREAWGGKLVLKCHKCQFAYRTEALWTERPQEWEKTLSK